MSSPAQVLTDLLLRFSGRRPAADSPATADRASAATAPAAAGWGLRGDADTDPSGRGVRGGVEEAQHPSKALGRFLKSLQPREAPVLIDLGPVVGGNLNFFGEHLGCRIRVEDVFVDLESHAKAGSVDALANFFQTRFPQPPESVDGILCWDVFDFLDRPAAQALATVLTKLLRPDGVLLGFFNTGESRTQVYTKFVVVDEGHLRYRTYPASRPRQRPLANRDIIRLFDGLRVTDSFLMKTNVREMLFRRPAYLSTPD